MDNPKHKEESHSKRPKVGKIILYVILAIVALAALGAAGTYWYVNRDTTQAGILYVEDGVVQVQRSASGQWLAAENGMNLKEDYSVRTLEGTATIVLYGQNMVSLDPNSQVSIAELSAEQVAVNHDSGSVWSKVVQITGTQEFQVVSPTTVATVRGTGFGSQFRGSKHATLVGEGTVEVKSLKTGEAKDITENMKVTVDESGALLEEELTADEREYVKKKMLSDLQSLKRERRAEIAKYPLVVNTIKDKYGLTDADIQRGLEGIDRGEYDIDELEKQLPVPVNSIGKIKGMTEEIQELQEKLQEQ